MTDISGFVEAEGVKLSVFALKTSPLPPFFEGRFLAIPYCALSPGVPREQNSRRREEAGSSASLPPRLQVHTAGVLGVFSVVHFWFRLVQLRVSCSQTFGIIGIAKTIPSGNSSEPRQSERLVDFDVPGGLALEAE